MQVYHLKSSCQAKMANQPKWPEIGLSGIDPNIVSNKSVDGTIGESGISTIILNIWIDLGMNFRALWTPIAFH